jgi:hypothetical protein
VIERIAGEESLHGLCEMIFECDVDAANGAVEVDGAEQIGAGFDEVDERWQSAGVNGEPVFGEEAVVNESGDVEGFGVVARHVGVA